MNLRLVLLVLMGFVSTQFSPGDENPIVFDKQFSADQVITTKDGATITNRIYTSDSKVRSEMDMQGTKIVAIIRPDLMKMYSIMDAQKMVMVMPFDSSKYKEQMAAATGVQGKYENLGADAIEGVPCTKYKVTSSDGDKNVYFLWADAKKMPVKMMAADGTFTMLWKNYVPGPQSASLFEPPTGYQMIDMPNMPNLPMPGAGQ